MTNETNKRAYLLRENLKRRQLIKFIELGLRCNVKVEGDFALGIIDDEDLDLVPRETPTGPYAPRDYDHPDHPDHYQHVAETLRFTNIELQNEVTNITKDCQHWKDKCTELQATLGKVRKERDELLDKATAPETSAPTSEGLPIKDKKLDLDGDVKNGPDLTKKGKPRKSRRRLTNEQVWKIRHYLKMGRENIWISRTLGIPIATIWKIKDGRTYTEVPDEPKRKPTTVHAGHGVVKND